MMGQINHDQGQLLYSFNLEEVVPDDLIRSIARVLNFSWFRVRAGAALFSYRTTVDSWLRVRHPLGARPVP